MNALQAILRLPVVVSIGLLTAIIWWGSLDNAFHYDDEHSIQLNIHLRVAPEVGALTDALASFFSDPSTFSRDKNKGMYRPLLVSSFALNHAANLAMGRDGYDTVGFHVVNMIIHGANACLLWWLICLLWPRSGRAGTGLMAAALFVAWPLVSEPVNYISSRSESMAALFYLLALCLWLRAQRNDHEIWRWSSWVAVAAGLLTKSTAITLPAALLLIDLTVISRFDVRRVMTRLWRWHVPGYLIAVGYLVTITLNGFLGRSVGAPVRDAGSQLLTQLKAIGYYLHLLVMPTHLSVEPQFQEQAGINLTVVMGALVAASLIAALVWLWRRRHGRALALLGIGILHMLPSMVMPLNVFVNERRAYLPLAMACIGVTVLTVHLGRNRRRRLPLAALGVLVLVIAGTHSYERNRVWADSHSLWAEAAARAPQMPRPHLYLGNAFKDQALRTPDPGERAARWRQASEQYELTLSMPSDADLRLRALNNLGGVHFELGDIDAAEVAFRRAVETSPQYADGLINLGNALLKKAMVMPDHTSRHRGFTESLEYYSRGLQVEPNNYYGHSNLGVAMQELGRLDEAESSYRRALFLFPQHDGSLSNLAALLLRKAEMAAATPEQLPLLHEADRLARRSLAINPAQPRAREILRLVSQRLPSSGGE